MEDVAKQQNEQKYVFWDTELTDKSAISYYAQAHLMQKYQNKLLGDFDKTGKYKISEDVLKELVAVKKYVDKKQDDKTFLSAVCGKYVLKFVMQVGQVDSKTKYASLKFLEENALVGCGEKVALISAVAYYKDVDDKYFDEKVGKVFNIQKKPEGDGKKFDNKDIAKKIFDTMSTCDKLFSQIVKFSKDKNKLYVKGMLRIFENSGKFGQFALRRYKVLVNQYAKNLDPKSDMFWFTLKQIIDQIMYEEEKKLSKEIAILLSKIRTKYVPSVEKTIEKAKNPPKKVEEKPIKLKGTGGLVFKPQIYKSGGGKKAAKKSSSSPYIEQEEKNKASIVQKKMTTTKFEEQKNKINIDPFENIWTQKIQKWEEAISKIVVEENEVTISDKDVSKTSSELNQSLEKNLSKHQSDSNTFDFS